VTTGSRSEYGILRPVMKEILNNRKFDLYTIVAGMHLSKKHGFTIKEIPKDGFKIYATINMIPEGNSPFFMAKSLGKGVIEFSKIFQKLKPDINLILGDRDEAFASSLAASHMNIPNAHIHGGDRTQAGIDEYNRHAITKISNIHFAATRESKQRIIRLGENPKYVFYTGSPSIDEIVEKRISIKTELEKKYKINFTGDEILLIQHPVTTEIENTEKQINNILKALVKLKRTVIAIAPNSDSGNYEIFSKLIQYSKKYKFIKLYKSLPRKDYLGFLQNCSMIVGNSSSAIIDSSYFNIPAINIGIRQNDREKGKNVLDVKKNSIREISSAIIKASKIKRDKIYTPVYGKGNASKKIVNILEKISLNKELIQKKIFY